MPLNDRRNFKGSLVAVENGNITVEVDGQEYILAVANIEKGNLVPTF